MRNTRVALLALLCTACVAPSSASAAITLGPVNPNPNPDNTQAINWPPGSLLFNATAPASVQLAAPSDGVITSWVFYTDDVGNEATAQLRTLTPLGSKSYAVNGAGAIEPLPPIVPTGAQERNVRHAFGASLPIAAGQITGVSLTRAAGSYILPLLPVQAEWEYGAFCSGCPAEVPAPGSSATAFQTNGQMLSLNATFELDVDQDGLGDETQDPCVGICLPSQGGPSAPPASQPSPAPPTAAPPKPKKKCGKGKRLKRGKCVKKHKPKAKAQPKR